MMPVAGKKVLVFGGTGTAGRAAVQAMIDAGHDVTCFTRSQVAIDGASVRMGDFKDVGSVVRYGFAETQFDAVVSCLASRTGSDEDAWTIDYRAHSDILKAAHIAGVAQFILLSAICVQKPKLGFQKAKLAFETELLASGMTYSIVRPTAFFKSLSGQIDRVKAGKPFLVFGDGNLTACKPISDRDLGHFIALCLTDPDKANKILPIGGPGPAITARAQGEILFAAAQMPVRFKQVPIAMMSMIIKGLDIFGIVSSKAKAKSQLARIGHYYATESMLVWDGNRYDAKATPSFGQDHLADYYAQVLAGETQVERGDHAVF